MVKNSRIHKAMVLAAGEGTRLRPLTLTTPKVLLPVGNGGPLLAHILRWLKTHGIDEVAINLHHLGGQIIEFAGDGSRYGVKIVYSQETSLLGTAGGVKRVESFFDGPFIVIYGDVFTDLDIGKMLRFHINKKAVATMAVSMMPSGKEVGVVDLAKDGKVISFQEKTACNPDGPCLANGAVYVLEKNVLDYIPGKIVVDFGQDIFPALIRLGLPVYGYRLPPGEYLIDIGTIEKYRQAGVDVAKGRIKFMVQGRPGRGYRKEQRVSSVLTGDK